MASIWKRKAERRDPSAKWRITYVDEHGKPKTVTGYTDRRATDELARKRETDAGLRRRGVHDPTAERIAEQGRVPVAEHVAAFVE